MANKVRLWPVILGAVALMTLFVAGGAWRLSRAPQTEDLQRFDTVALPQAREITWPRLVDSHSQLLSQQRLRGYWTLIFFGFSNCQDICPTTVSMLSTVKKQFDGSRFAGDTRYLMISVDPERDTSERLFNWLAETGGGVEGAWGDAGEIYRLAREFGATFQRRPASGPNYQLAHSGHIFIVDDAGFYRGFIREPQSPEQLSRGYRSLRLLAEADGRP